jgi:murein DD-endopeptidase MepM/ murein hydrolase activator NlpD
VREKTTISQKYKDQFAAQLEKSSIGAPRFKEPPLSQENQSSSFNKMKLNDKEKLTKILALRPLAFDKNKKSLVNIKKTENNISHQQKIIEYEPTAQNNDQATLDVTTQPVEDLVVENPVIISAPVRKASTPEPVLKEAAINKPQKINSAIDPTLSQFKKSDTRPQQPIRAKTSADREQYNFIWPLEGPVISTFGPKSNGLKNDGINIGTSRGTPIVSSDGGTVAYSGSDIPGFGNVILVRHANGLMTTYAHMERVFVQKDMIVAKGDMIGTAGTSGGLDTPQLHFEIRRGNEALDPSKYLYSK